MTSVDEARRREARDQWKLFPFAILGLVLLCGIYFVALVEGVVVFDTRIWGVAKNIWFLTVIALAGLGVFSVFMSFSLVILASIVARKLSVTLPPLKPLYHPTIYLILGYIFFSAALYAERFVRTNVEHINNYYENAFGFGFADFMLGTIWLLVLVWVCTNIFALIVLAVALPFQSREIVKELRNDH